MRSIFSGDSVVEVMGILNNRLDHPLLPLVSVVVCSVNLLNGKLPVACPLESWEVVFSCILLSGNMLVCCPLESWEL